MNKAPQSSLLPWKKRRPVVGSDEDLTAELLKQVGEPAKLSPEAFSRIGRQLRERQRSRLPLFADMRLALLAGGMASVAIVGALSFLMLSKAERAVDPTATAAVKSRLPSDQTLAMADAPAAPDVATENRGGADEPRAKLEAKGGARFASPPPESGAQDKAQRGVSALGGLGFGAAGSKAAGESRRMTSTPGGPSGLSGLADQLASNQQPRERKAKKAAGHANQTAEGFADGTFAAPYDDRPAPSKPASAPARVAEKSAPAWDLQDTHELARADEATPAAAGAPLPAPTTATAPQRFAQPPPVEPASPAISKKDAFAVAGDTETLDQSSQSGQSSADGETVDRCLSAYPPAKIAGQDQAAERALFARAKCHLNAGQRDQGRSDLQAYLSRFPTGLFADQARALLLK